MQYSFLAKKSILQEILFAPKDSLTSFFTIGITQWITTPSDLDATTPVKNDYPYSGVLFIHLDREKLLSPQKIIISTLYLGVIGPAALAETNQSVVHKYLKDELPEGWDNQLPNYPVINYGFTYEQSFFSINHLAMNAFSATQIGTLLNTEKAGLDLAVSSRKRDAFPARPYQLNKKEAQHTSEIYLRIMPSVQFVASNGMLQGSLFEKKNFYHVPDNEMERIVYELSGTIGVRLHNFFISYSQIKQSRLFKTVHSHSYGFVNIGFRI